MNTNPKDSARLPVTHELTLAYALSLVVAIVMTIASVGGLLYRAVIYPTDALLLSFIPNDVLNLVVGLPILLGSMRLARRGKLIGLLCWPGALFYVLYVYVIYAIGVPFNALFPAYLALVPLSAYTIIGIVASIDGEAVHQRLTGIVPARVAGGILAGLAILLIVRQAAIIVAALASQTGVDTLERALWIGDVTVGCPALLAGGVLLWRRKALGYVAGAGLLLQYGALALGLIPVMAFQALYTGSQIDVAGIIVVLFMGAICFVPLAFFVRGAASS